MIQPSSRYGTRHKNRRAIDLPALLVAVVVTGCGALAAAWWYGISWRDITSSGLFGLPFFVGMFAAFLGMPAYFVAYLLRRRAWRDLPKKA